MDRGLSRELLLSAIYSAKVNKQKHQIPSNAKFSSNTKALIHFKRHYIYILTSWTGLRMKEHRVAHVSCILLLENAKFHCLWNYLSFGNFLERKKKKGKDNMTSDFQENVQGHKQSKEWEFFFPSCKVLEWLIGLTQQFSTSVLHSGVMQEFLKHVILTI